MNKMEKTKKVKLILISYNVFYLMTVIFAYFFPGVLGFERAVLLTLSFISIVVTLMCGLELRKDTRNMDGILILLIASATIILITTF